MQLVSAVGDGVDTEWAVLHWRSQCHPRYCTGKATLVSAQAKPRSATASALHDR